MFLTHKSAFEHCDCCCMYAPIPTEMVYVPSPWESVPKVKSVTRILRSWQIDLVLKQWSAFTTHKSAFELCLWLPATCHIPTHKNPNLGQVCHRSWETALLNLLLSFSAVPLLGNLGYLEIPGWNTYRNRWNHLTWHSCQIPTEAAQTILAENPNPNPGSQES